MNGRRTTLALALAITSLAAAVAPTATLAGEGEADSLFLPSRSTPLVALRFVFRAGSQDDPRGKEGLAALTAAMVAEGGTKDLTYEQILKKFYPMAASLSGSCRKEVTVFSGTIHRDNLGGYESLATAMLTSPRFDPEDFERLRNEAIDYVSKTLRGSNDEEPASGLFNSSSTRTILTATSIKGRFWG